MVNLKHCRSYCSCNSIKFVRIRNKVDYYSYFLQLISTKMLIFVIITKIRKKTEEVIKF